MSILSSKNSYKADFLKVNLQRTNLHSAFLFKKDCKCSVLQDVYKQETKIF